MITRIKNYFLGAKKEFKGITWPSWLETRQLTAVVISISLVIAAFLGVFDYAFSYILQSIVL